MEKTAAVEGGNVGETESFPAGNFDSGRECGFSSLTRRKSRIETAVASNGLMGLGNLGNMGFMNSMLQCLSSTRLLADFFVSDEYETNLNRKSHMKGRLVRAFADLLKRMRNKKESSPLLPTEVGGQIRGFLPGYSKQDAHEFLRFLLDGLHEDLRIDSPKSASNFATFTSESDLASEKYRACENSKIADLFVGQLMSTLTFESCSHQSITYDTFWDLSLPIPRRKQSFFSSYDRLSTSVDSTLTDCFDFFTEPETMDGDNSPFCSKCNRKRRCTKRLTLSKLPPILVIHLKRFGVSTKISDVIKFPVERNVNLEPYLDSNSPSKGGQCLYKLYAVSNHMESTFSGHYTASCKHSVTDEWYLFDDSSVRLVDSSSVRGLQCYVLFYEKCKS
ncbi:ubiquitin carboxyl-terminal hydrolase 2-like isoform X2 [Oscarella lobularis]|uniref:ubiquitin carboxyl-terminal hydrolase 2-like isoform X2 n=1 Tax=Oscarella lobularis TaxID=121494 RepID=UPI003313C120